MMDESQIVREFLSRFRSAREMREEATPYLVLSLLGFLNFENPTRFVINLQRYLLLISNY